jgi:hypothetical protein
MIMNLVRGVLWCGFGMLVVVKSWPPTGWFWWAAVGGGVLLTINGLGELRRGLGQLTSLARRLG